MKAIEFVTEIKKGQKDSNGYTRCWSGKHAEGTKKGKNGGQVRNCVPNESVAEGHADQQRKVFKKNGEPVGEVGIDRESSPGVGQYYMKHYASGNDLAGYDSFEEAVAELKHCMKQGVAEGGAETSWSNDTDTITLQDILELTKHIKQINLPINDNLKSKLLHWEGNPEEIERVNQVTVSNQFPILIMVDEQGQIAWILDGNHRLHKAIQSQAKTIPAKLIRPNNLNDKAKKIFNIKEQGVAESADQVVKIFKDKSGKPIGEIGIDGEASPGNGNWYVAYHVTGYDAGGFDSYKEALDEFKAIAQEDGFKFYESQGVAEDTELAEEFDLIESIIEDLAASNGVDSEVIWEDLESLDDDELYVFATTTTIMETEAWQKANNRDKTDGMSRKAVKTYRREHPGSKLQTAVTTKPSKLKKGSKASKRRKSYCSRSRGQMKMHNISCAKTPDKAICKARRRWNC